MFIVYTTNINAVFDQMETFSNIQLFILLFTCRLQQDHYSLLRNSLKVLRVLLITSNCQQAFLLMVRKAWNCQTETGRVSALQLVFQLMMFQWLDGVPEVCGNLNTLLVAFCTELVTMETLLPYLRGCFLSEITFPRGLLT